MSAFARMILPSQRSVTGWLFSSLSASGLCSTIGLDSEGERDTLMGPSRKIKLFFSVSKKVCFELFSNQLFFITY